MCGIETRGTAAEAREIGNDDSIRKLANKVVHCPKFTDDCAVAKQWRKRQQLPPPPPPPPPPQQRPPQPDAQFRQGVSTGLAADEAGVRGEGNEDPDQFEEWYHDVFLADCWDPDPPPSGTSRAQLDFIQGSRYGRLLQLAEDPSKRFPPPTGEAVFPEAFIGSRVGLLELVARPELNGRTGRVVRGLNLRTQRIGVVLDPRVEGEAAEPLIAPKLSNVLPLSDCFMCVPMTSVS
eukprot:Hpha_TRINITY_DN16266_c0_g1::TRINITY_DN16266_c0_g1_i1::g.11618::m.11618